MVIGTAASKFKMNVIRLELTLMSMMVTMMGSLKMPVKMMTCRRGRGMWSWQRCRSPSTGGTACSSKGSHLPSPGHHDDDEEEEVEEDDEDEHDEQDYILQKLALVPKNVIFGHKGPNKPPSMSPAMFNPFFKIFGDRYFGTNESHCSALNQCH